MATKLDLTNPYQQDIIGLDRQRQLSQMLLQQGMQQPQGQMVSGRFVAPAFTERLANLLSVYAGQRGMEEADKKQLDLANKLRQQEATELGRFMELQQGRPAQQVEMAGPYGQGMGMDGANIPMPTLDMPAIQPNRVAALQYASQATSPALRQAGIKALTEGPIKVGVEDTLLDPITMQPIRQGSAKTPAEIQTAAIVLGLDRKPLDQWTPQDRMAIDEQIQKTKRSGAVNLGQKDFDNTLKLRGDFRSEPVYKGFQEVESAYGQINKGLDAKSPAGDLAAATKFMKLLDPSSVVRESELSMAMQATGALDKLYNYAKMLATGEKLTESQRNDFRTLAKEFYATAYDQYSNKRNEYVGIAERNKLNTEDVVGKPPKAPTKMLSSQDQQALNWANSNPNDPRAAQIKQRLGM